MPDDSADQDARTTGPNSPAINDVGPGGVTVTYHQTDSGLGQRLRAMHWQVGAGLLAVLVLGGGLLLAVLVGGGTHHAETRTELQAIREEIAREKGLEPELLRPIFDHLGERNLTPAQIRERAEEAIAAILDIARRPAPSDLGVDFDKVIAGVRAKLLREKADIERATYDHKAAEATLRQLLAQEPEDVWAWIDLGDLKVTTGSLDAAMEAFRGARAAAERLAAADPGNAGWQRDLIVSCVKLSEAAPGEARAWLTRALAVARDLAASGRLAPADAWMPADLERRLSALPP